MKVILYKLKKINGKKCELYLCEIDGSRVASNVIKSALRFDNNTEALQYVSKHSLKGWKPVVL